MLDIYLPEVERLRARVDQLEWLKEVKEVLDDPGVVSTDALTGFNYNFCSSKLVFYLYIFSPLIKSSFCLVADHPPLSDPTTNFFAASLTPKKFLFIL